MMEFDFVGIIGLGYVGQAINENCDVMTRVIIIDPAKGYPANYAALKETDGVFVCVPTPYGDDGSCDTSILRSVMDELKAVDYKGVIISKCTAPPSFYNELGKEFPNLVYCPEFLTAANAVVDYASAKFLIIGGTVGAYINEAKRIIAHTQPNVEAVYGCSFADASLAKYAINSFLATKVVFMNELYQLAQAQGADYQLIARMMREDARIGSSHMKVPGPDGTFGFGGMCFPKDTSALLKHAESLGVVMNVLDAAVKKNTLLRLTDSK